MKIGVISDTHVRSIDEIPGDIIRSLGSMDLIIHAGDFVHPDVLTGLQTIAKVKAVCGNMDSGDLRDILPVADCLCINNRKIGIIHGWGSPWDWR
jgi:putative phosphoesterase